MEKIPCCRVIVLKTFVNLEINLIIIGMYPKITIVTLNSAMFFSNRVMAYFTWVFSSHNIRPSNLGIAKTWRIQKSLLETQRFG